MQDLSILRNQIDRASAAYYRGRAIVPDNIYDIWIKQLKLNCPIDERITRVGPPPYSAAELRTKVEHDFPCGSLDNLDQSIVGYGSWISKMPDTRVMASLKMDGNSLDLKYLNGQLVRATTRGSGLLGDNVTANAVMFNGVSTCLPEAFTGNVRGEAILSRRAFKDLESDGEELSNPRNVGSGIIGRKNGSQSELIDFIAFGVYPMVDGSRQILDYTQQFENLVKLGFQVVEHKLCNSTNDVEQYFAAAMARRDILPYEIDGVVVQLDSGELRKRLVGDDLRELMRPVYGRAIKPPTQSNETVLTGLKTTVGHTGANIPTADVHPVRVGGVTVSSVLLNNWDEILSYDLHIGDIVEVGLMGDVIPKIISSKPGENRTPLPAPTGCASCGGPLTRKECGDGEESAHLFCTNPECPGILVAKVDHWIGTSKKGVGILEIGDAILGELFSKKIVSDPADLYTLQQSQLAELVLPGKNGRTVRVGDSRAATILANIQAKREIPLHVFLGALGIDLLGSRRAEQMIKKSEGALCSIEQWIDGKTLASIKMPGFGEIQRAAICAGLESCRPLITKLLANGVVPIAFAKKVVAAGTSPVTGKSFCWTGTREYLERVVALGGIEKSGVSKGLDFLVQKDSTQMTSKARKAIEYGTKIIGVEYLGRVLAGEAELE